MLLLLYILSSDIRTCYQYYKQTNDNVTVYHLRVMWSLSDILTCWIAGNFNFQWLNCLFYKEKFQGTSSIRFEVLYFKIGKNA